MSELQIARVFTDKIEAELAKGMLESEGIESFISGDDAGGMRPDLLAGLGGAKLLVKEADLHKALEILSAYFDN